MRIALRGSIVFAALACAAAAYAGTSLDWFLRSSGTTMALNSVCFGHDRYIAFGYDGFKIVNVMLVSSNGVNWTARTPPATNANFRCAFGNNSFVLAAQTRFWRSADGDSWTDITPNVPIPMSNLRFINGVFLGIDRSASVCRSTDGITWTKLKSAQSDCASWDIAAGNNVYVVAGQTSAGKVFIARSADSGASWTTVQSDVNGPIRSVAYGNGLFVAVGGTGSQRGLIMTSADGQAWDTLTATHAYKLERVIFDAGMFVALLDGGDIIVSTDGQQWTLQSSVTGKACYDICYAQNKFLAVGYKGVIVQSGPTDTRISLTPTGVSASDGTYRDIVRVTWDAEDDAIGYEVWRCASNNTVNASRLGSTSAAVYDDPTAAAIPGTILYYWIKTVTAEGTNDFSSPDSGFTTGKNTLNDYDGDGLSDLAVFREGYWSIYLMSGSILCENQPIWTGSDYIPVPGDYDGDRISDLAVFRDGYWFIYLMGDGTMLEGSFGAPGSIPVPGDYDGDGLSDLAVFRDGYWSIYLMNGGILCENQPIWVGPDYIPVPGDYDGDGLSDLAVFRDGYWSIYLMNGSILCENQPIWTGPGYIPVPGDYDGDRISDLAVFRDGYWSIYLMSGSVLCENQPIWVGPDYIPVPGDYDGDGLSDLAVFREGYWSIYLMNGSVLCENQPLWVGPGYIPVR